MTTTDNPRVFYISGAVVRHVESIEQAERMRANAGGVVAVEVRTPVATNNPDAWPTGYANRLTDAPLVLPLDAVCRWCEAQTTMLRFGDRMRCPLCARLQEDV